MVLKLRMQSEVSRRRYRSKTAPILVFYVRESPRTRLIGEGYNVLHVPIAVKDL